jgi:hypothetical protein
MIEEFEEGSGISFNPFHPIDVDFDKDNNHFEWQGLALCDVLTGD